jgi:hypothetical protein
MLTIIIAFSHAHSGSQYLEEDPRINRIDDSLQLFSAIIENQLLKNTHLVLLLNKVCLSCLVCLFPLPLPFPYIHSFIRPHFPFNFFLCSETGNVF